MRACVLALASVLLCVPASSQTSSASVVGRVTDATGAVIPGARIRVTNVDTNIAHDGVANSVGDYTVLYLQPGRYSLEATQEGFRTHRRPEFTVAIDQVMRLDIELQVGATSDSVTVTETAPVVNTENGTRGDVTTTEEINEMPLGGRNFADLAYLTGGVTPRSEEADGVMAINGARADNTGFLLNGMNNTQRRNTNSIASPPLEGVQEFKMITSGYSAEYGRYAGGVLSVVLKSGGNRFRGTLYEFLRNDVFDARNFFDVEKSKLRRNQFGATGSGPVLIPKLYNGRNRTFFLVSWESLRQTDGDVRRGVVPWPEMMQGDFSRAVNASGKPLIITDTLAKAPFPGNKIPVSRFDPVTAKMAALYPTPNLVEASNNYLRSGNSTSNYNNYTVKVDHMITQNDQLSALTVWKPSRSYNPFSSSSKLYFFGADTDSFDLLSGLRYTRTISASLIAEASTSFSRKTYVWGWGETGAEWPAKVGFGGGTTNPTAMGLPEMQITGYVLLGHAYDLPKIWAVNNYEHKGAITWIKNNHTLKFGGDFLRFQYFSRQYGDTRGRLTFQGRFTGEPFADFLLGWAQSSRRQLDAAGPYHLVSNYSGFVQDDWKITPRLTLNIGMRYDLMKPPKEKYGAWSVFVPELGKVVVAGKGTLPDFDTRIQNSGVAQYVTMAADAGLPETIAYTDRNDFGPRFGFAWRPFGGTATVVRGGYGIFYGSSSLYRMDEFGDTYPFSITETYSATSSNPLLLTVSDAFPEAKRKISGVTGSSGQEVRGRSQYLQSWNWTVEREFAGGSVVEFAYAGSKGTHLPRRYDINQPLRSAEVRAAGGTFPRPFPYFSTINYFSAGSNSTYNSGSVTYRRRFSQKLFVRAAYTYSKSIDESSNTGGTIAKGFSSAQDSRNLKLERGRSDFDIGHSFVGSFIWQPQFSTQAVLRNWQLAGTTRAYTGQPFTVRVANYQADLGEAARPDRIAKGTLDNPGPDAWFDREAFVAVPLGAYRFGTAGRNILDGPGSLTVDLGISRRFRFTESTVMQFRWEMFNVPNHTNFNLPENNIDVRNGATITKAKGARVHQVAIRLEF